jgi:hypothetical protein
MERKDFLKNLGLGGVSLFIPGLSPGEEMGKLTTQKVKIYDNYLKGGMYYDLLNCIKEIHLGDQVTLERKTAHRYDRFAIGLRWKGNFLGYIPAYENIVLANLMDVGVELEAMITYKASVHEVGIGVWAYLVVPYTPPATPLTEKPADRIEDLYRKHRIITKK